MDCSKRMYSLLAYDKKHDTYDIIAKSDDYDEMFDLAQILAPILHSKRLLSKFGHKPYEYFTIYNNEDCEYLDII